MLMQPGPGDPDLNYTAQEFRQNFRSALAMSSGVSGEQGVTSKAGFAVTQRGAGANFTVDVAAGHAFVLGDDVTNQGTYFCWNDGVVNVTIPAPPASGSRTHRIVLQVEDKLNNATWSGYTGVLLCLADTGTGTPAEPNSAISLATVAVAAGQASVTNANITDIRARVGPVAALKPVGTNTSRASTVALTDDPDLQLLNLAPSAVYELRGWVEYDGGTGSFEGDLQFQWRQPAGQTLRYSAERYSASDGSAISGNTLAAGQDILTAQTQGVGTPLTMRFTGRIATQPTVPCYAVLQWSQGTATTANTTIYGGSYLYARRIA